MRNFWSVAPVRSGRGPHGWAFPAKRVTHPDDLMCKRFHKAKLMCEGVATKWKPSRGVRHTQLDFRLLLPFPPALPFVIASDRRVLLNESVNEITKCDYCPTGARLNPASEGNT